MPSDFDEYPITASVSKEEEKAIATQYFKSYFDSNNIDQIKKYYFYAFVYFYKLEKQKKN
jgi:hypothetical protein